MAAQKEQNKLAFIVVTHGDIGASMLAVAEYILGRKLDNFVFVRVPFMGELQHVIEGSCLTPFAERRQIIKEEMRKAKKNVDKDGGIIVLTDLLGGTGFNVAREFFDRNNELVIAGVNLPMLLKAAEAKEENPVEVAADLVDRTRGSVICHFPAEREK